jgi:AcrR family transcriptional regulator
MPRPKSNIDVRILHSARARFLMQGVDGASLRAIAKDAGTNIGMIYYYFPSKDDLFLAVVEEVYERVLADFATALQDDVPVAARVQRLYERIGRLDEEEFAVLRLVIREALISSSRLEQILDRFRRGHIPLVLKTITDGIADGTFSAERHPLLIFSSMIALGSLAQLVSRVLGARMAPPLTRSGPELARDLAQLLLHGAAGSR